MDDVVKIWAASYQSVTDEVTADLPIVEGELPADLRGVLYRNGPGRFSVGGDTYEHFFDGDGMVLRFAIGAKSSDSRPRVRYRNAYVQTRELVAENRAGRILYRGFGTNLPGGLRKNFMRMRFKNAANTSVVYHPVTSASSTGKNGKKTDMLLALWEGGLPHRLDPRTLSTLAREDFDGELQNRGSWFDRLMAPELPFSAHPKRDLITGDLYNFGVTSGPKTRLLLYKLDAQGQGQSQNQRKCKTLRQLTLPHFAFVHDFCLTPNYFVFFICPMKFDEKGILMGYTTVAGSLQALAKDGVPTRVLLVPRDGGDAIWQETSACFIFHLANAYEDESGQVVVDGCRQPEYPPFPSVKDVLQGRIGVFPRATMTRFTIDPKAPAGSRVKEEPVGDHASELPTIAPGFSGRRHRYIWAVGPSRPQHGEPRHHNITTSIVRHDVQTKTSVIRDFSTESAPGLPSEPLFVRRATDDQKAPNEEDGYLLSVVYHGPQNDKSGDTQRSHRSTLHVLNPNDLSTICVALLPHHVPPGFHGTFVQAADCAPGWQE